MKKKLALSMLGALVVALAATPSVQAQQAGMTFFVSSVGKGNGADLGGLEGADAHCAALARAAGLDADQLASIPEHDDARG